MSNVHLDDKLIVVFRTGFVAAGNPVSLDVLDNSYTYVNLSAGDEVEDEINPPSGVTAVVVHVLDDGTHEMTVTPVGGGSAWSRNTSGAVPYSYGSINIPAVEGATNELTVSISTPGASARSQKIIIKRRPSPFMNESKKAE